MDSLSVLKKCCLFYPSKRINSVVYKLLDAMGVRAVSSEDSTRVARIKDVLRRLYHSSPKDIDSFIRWLPKYFKDSELAQFLGVDISVK